MSVETNYPKISIVVLNFNTADLLLKLLPTVLNTDYPNLEVVMADNASTDGSADIVEDKFNDVRVIRLNNNLGFAGGYNEVLKQVNSDYWLLLNSDVEVSKNWLMPMMNLMLSNPEIAAVQPKILDYARRDTFEYAGGCGGYMDRWGYPFCRGRVFTALEKDNGQFDDSQQVFWASGAALLVRANDYKSVGGMDDDFFAHMEEIDLCWRIQNIGKQVWVCPESTVYHMGGGTLNAHSSFKTFLNFRNNLALLTKNLPVNKVLTMLLTRLILDGIAGVKYILEFRFGHCWAIIRAHSAFYLKAGSWWAKRQQIPNHKSTEDLVGWHPKSIVWAFFIKRLKTFGEVMK
jgi:GT2 family glycosyltransferase